MINYTLSPATRYSAYLGANYPVEEIRIDGELVGSTYASNNYRFGEVTDASGSYPHGDCVLDTSRSRDVMVSRILRHRAVGNHDDWRSRAAKIELEECRQVS